MQSPDGFVVKEIPQLIPHISFDFQIVDFDRVGESTQVF